MWPNPFFLLLAQEQQSGGGGYREFIDAAARTPLSEVVLIVSVLTVLRLAIYPYLKNTIPHKRVGIYSLARFANEVLDAVVYAGVFVFMIIRPFGIQAFLIPSGSMWPTLYVNDFIVANKAVYRYSDPKDGDVVVFRPPVEATNPDQRDAQGNVKVDFIKRCQGVPGDVVELRDGILYRNGKAASDPHKHYSTDIDGVTFVEMTEEEVRMKPMASFKLINYKGHIIPCNYTKTEANASTVGYDHLYDVAEKFVIPPEDQQYALSAPPQPVPKGCYLMMGDNRNQSFDSRGWGFVPRAQIIGRGEFIWMPLNRIGKVQ